MLLKAFMSIDTSGGVPLLRPAAPTWSSTNMGSFVIDQSNVAVMKALGA